MPTLTTPIQQSTRSPTQENQEREKKKKVKETQIQRKELKLPSFADNMIFYRENPKYITKNLLEPINEFKNCWAQYQHI